MPFIQININNSFNHQETKSNNTAGESLSSYQKGNTNSLQINSINSSSITNSEVRGIVRLNFSDRKTKLSREILLATISAIIGAVITYLLKFLF